MGEAHSQIFSGFANTVIPECSLPGVSIRALQCPSAGVCTTLCRSSGCTGCDPSPTARVALPRPLVLLLRDLGNG